MAYKIEYAPEISRRYRVKKKRRIPVVRVLFIGMLLFAALWMRRNGVPDFLIPGDAQVTRSATKELIDQVQTGMPVREALTVFCHQIIDGAGF